MTLWDFLRKWLKIIGCLAQNYILSQALAVIFMLSLNSVLIAKSAFQTQIDQVSTRHHFEQYELQYACADDFHAYSRILPCPKCRIVTGGDGHILTLIAADQAGLDELRTLVAALDKPKEQLVVALCCLLIQEHEVAPFLATVMQQPQLFYHSWQEGVLELATEMSKEGSVVVLATPKISVQLGRQAQLSLHDEALVHKELKYLENYGLSLDLKLLCMRGGDQKFLIDVHFIHQLFVKSQGGIDPKQRKELKTQIGLCRGETGFLGSAGHIGLIQEKGYFNILKILPEKLWPKAHDQRQINSELIVLMSVD